MKRNESLSACLHFHKETTQLQFLYSKPSLGAFKGTLFPNGHDFETTKSKELTLLCINYGCIEIFFFIILGYITPIVSFIILLCKNDMFFVVALQVLI